MNKREDVYSWFNMLWLKPETQFYEDPIFLLMDEQPQTRIIEEARTRAEAKVYFQSVRLEHDRKIRQINHKTYP